MISLQALNLKQEANAINKTTVAACLVEYLR